MIEWKLADELNVKIDDGSRVFFLIDKGNGALYRLRRYVSVEDQQAIRIKRGTLRFAKTLDYRAALKPIAGDLMAVANLFRLKPISNVKKATGSAPTYRSQVTALWDEASAQWTVGVTGIAGVTVGGANELSWSSWYHTAAAQEDLRILLPDLDASPIIVDDVPPGVPPVSEGGQ